MCLPMPRASEPAPAIIVFNGCFCPVHAGHVQALEDAKQKLEARGDVRVVAGYFAVAPDHFVRSKVKKVGGRLEQWMTAASRVDMCRAVAQDVGWAVSAHECESWKRLGAAMIAQNHAASTKLFGVRAEAKGGGVRKKGDGETAGLSSTTVRAELLGRGCAPEAVDDLVEQGTLGRAVGECLKEKLAASSLAPAGPRAAEHIAPPHAASSLHSSEPSTSIAACIGGCASGPAPLQITAGQRAAVGMETAA